MYKIVLAVFAAMLFAFLFLADADRGKRMWNEFRETGRVGGEHPQTLYRLGIFILYLVAKGFFDAFAFRRYPPGSPQKILDASLTSLLIIFLLVVPDVRRAVRDRRETGRVGNKKRLALDAAVLAMAVAMEILLLALKR